MTSEYTLPESSLSDGELYDWIIRSKACWSWYGQITEPMTLEPGDAERLIKEREDD